MSRAPGITPATRDLRDLLEAATDARRQGDNRAADMLEADAVLVLRRMMARAA